MRFGVVFAVFSVVSMKLTPLAMNPEFVLWDTKDQALISMISDTLSLPTLALVIG